MLSFKKLPMLVSYMSIFVIVASSVRRTEVPAFLTYTLILAVICGVGDRHRVPLRDEPLLQLDAEVPPAALHLRGQRDRGRARCPRPPLDRGSDRVRRGGHRHDGDGAPDRHRRDPQLADPAAPGARTGSRSPCCSPAMLATAAQERVDRARGGHRDAGVLPPARAAVAGAARPGHRGDGGGGLAGRRSRRRRPVHRGRQRPAWRPPAIAPPTTTPSVPTCGRTCCSAVASAATTTTPTGSSTRRSSGAPIETGVLGLAAFLLIGLSVILLVAQDVSRTIREWAPAALCGTAAAVCFLAISTLYDVMALPARDRHVPLPGGPCRRGGHRSGRRRSRAGAVQRAAHGPGASPGAAPRRPTRSRATEVLETPARWSDSMGIGIRLRKLWHLKVGRRRQRGAVAASRRSGASRRSACRRPA